MLIILYQSKRCNRGHTLPAGAVTIARKSVTKFRALLGVSMHAFWGIRYVKRGAFSKLQRLAWWLISIELQYYIATPVRAVFHPLLGYSRESGSRVSRRGSFFGILVKRVCSRRRWGTRWVEADFDYYQGYGDGLWADEDGSAVRGWVVVPFQEPLVLEYGENTVCTLIEYSKPISQFRLYLIINTVLSRYFIYQ
jgi:hypothetical protein